MRWLLILLAGCNFVYGLDETTVAPLDRDGDRQYPPDDNCPDDFNPLQEDDDGDDVGNACDTCPTVEDPTNHDEDGDRHGDACDLCATEPDFQEDQDGDGVGDGCDSDLISGPSVSTKLVFDSFFTLDEDRWSLTGDWAHANTDSLSPTTDTATLTLRAGAVDHAFYNIDLGIEATEPWRAGDVFGVRMVENGTVRARCEVRCEPACTLYIEYEGQTQPPRVVSSTRPLVHLRMRLTPNGAQTDYAYICALDSVIAGLIQLGNVDPRGTLEITAGGGIDLRFVGAWKHVRP